MKKVEFIYPKTLSVNMGNGCKIHCKHCGGHYLKAMTPAFLLPKSELTDYESILLSGGCNENGEMFWDEEILKSLPNQRINLHIGHYNVEKFSSNMEKIDYISMDFTVDEEIIQNIYRLNQKSEDFKNRFKYLFRAFREKLVPHICIGLHHGKVLKEYDAIHFLASYSVKKLVFIVFIPTVGTEMYECPRPDISEVVKVIKYAKKQMPGTKIQLGCMRPSGRYRLALEMKLLEEECVDSIVMPCSSTVKHARLQGCHFIEKGACCVFE